MKALHIVVTGANGQLGTELIHWLAGVPGLRTTGLGRKELDITDNRKTMQALAALQPDIVIHCAAYTAVDQAEGEASQAFLVNGYGTRNVAVAAEAIGAKLVYISTDYVFNGELERSYHEFDTPHPINVYGSSKLAGEHFVQQFHSRFFICRTSWVYGAYGTNFVRTMLELADQRSVLSVVADQIGCPTYTADLARVICELMQSDCYGVYHVSGSGSCSWHRFAQEIFRLAGKAVRVEAVTTEQYARPAARPRHSVLGHDALRLNGFAVPRPWEEALAAFIQAEYRSFQKISSGE